ncbi:MAG TPA: TraR/DksA family transcriptional regulator [Candidatus Aquilonibacter sp.]|nr:TraR/DksA family transcriptional regulator [Candidatus Aquilonibacter sp.]
MNQVAFAKEYEEKAMEKVTMNKSDVEQLRKKLELQRQEIMHFLKQLEEETRSLDADSAQDPADQCVSSMSKESLFQQSSQRRTSLRLIEAALRRIEDRTFGECAGCSNEIPIRRLNALPWTQFCLRCQEAIERERGGSVSGRPFLAPPEVALKRAG